MAVAASEGRRPAAAMAAATDLASRQGAMATATLATLATTLASPSAAAAAAEAPLSTLAPIWPVPCLVPSIARRGHRLD